MSLGGVVILSSTGAPLLHSNLRHPLPSYASLLADHFRHHRFAAAATTASTSAPSGRLARRNAADLGGADADDGDSYDAAAAIEGARQTGVDQSTVMPDEALPSLDDDLTMDLAELAARTGSKWRPMDVEPVLWVPGLPPARPLGQPPDEEEDEDEDDLVPHAEEDCADGDDYGGVAADAKGAGTAGQQRTAKPRSPRTSWHGDEANIWAEQLEKAEAAEREVVGPEADGVPREDAAPKPTEPPPPSAAVVARGVGQGALQSGATSDEPAQTGAAASAGVSLGGAATSAELLTDQGVAIYHRRVNDLTFLCVVDGEINPMIPTTFLSTLIDVLEAYLVGSSHGGRSGATTAAGGGKATRAAAGGAVLDEDRVRDHFDVVLQLLEEMLDSGTGWCLTTHGESLREVVRPREWWRDVVARLGANVGVGVAASLAPAPTHPAQLALPAIPWRKPTPPRQANNELYLDVVETLHGTVARDGRPVQLDCVVDLEMDARLSGVPEVTLRLNEAAASLQEPSFHACVRHRAWTKRRELCFVPPEGRFTLASFLVAPTASSSSSSPTHHVGAWARQVPIAATCKRWTDEAGKHRFEVSLSVAAKLGASGGLGGALSASPHDGTTAVERVEVRFDLGAGCEAVDADVSGGPSGGGGGSSTAASASSVVAGVVGEALGGGGGGGRGAGGATKSSEAPAGVWRYSAKERRLTWSVARIRAGDRAVVLRGEYATSDHPPRLSSSVCISWCTPGANYSRLGVASLQVTGEPYRALKASRNVAAGEVAWRW